MLAVLNDLHIGANRVAGTTTSSRLALRKHILEKFSDLLARVDGDLIILGDLFDSFECPLEDFGEAWRLLKQWLERGVGDCYLVAGNHDLSKTSNVVGSFDLLATLLDDYDNFMVIKEPTSFPYGYIIPHLPSQELFNEALKLVPVGTTLFLHTNYDNYFATQSDHSLNLSEEQRQALKCRLIVIGHEHNFKTHQNVVLPGNQIATSVADWVNSPEKYFIQVAKDSEGITDVRLTPLSTKKSEYVELGWEELRHTHHLFVKVVGEAKSEQASQVVAAIAKFRRESSAFVITNGVKFLMPEGADVVGEVLETDEGFSLPKLLKAMLTPEQYEIVEEVSND
jgi:UDP-2,3-diacylglucosamine pyrophosphatase LpxH